MPIEIDPKKQRQWDRLKKKKQDFADTIRAQFLALPCLARGCHAPRDGVDDPRGGPGAKELCRKHYSQKRRDDAKAAGKPPYRRKRVRLATMATEKNGLLPESQGTRAAR